MRTIIGDDKANGYDDALWGRPKKEGQSSDYDRGYAEGRQRAEDDFQGEGPVSFFQKKTLGVPRWGWGLGAAGIIAFMFMRKR